MVKLIENHYQRREVNTQTGIASAMADQWGDESKLPVAVEQLSIF